MPSFDYDLFVIGAGSGGVRAARLASTLAKKRVAIAEEQEIGGTCVIRGCVPKKLLVYGSEFALAFKDAERFGWSVTSTGFDWVTLRNEVQKEVARLSGIYQQNLLKAGVDVFESRATLVDRNTVRLLSTGRTYSAKHILIATGSRTLVPSMTPGYELGIASSDAFQLAKLPESIVIVGGGYIACEFASIFNGLGVHTTLVCRSDRVLRGFDRDVREQLQSDLQRLGISVVSEAVVESVRPLVGGRRKIAVSNGASLEADHLLWAIGRRPNTEGLGLDHVGVTLRDKAVVVDDFSRTNISSISAIGDVTDRLNLTPVAIREATAFVATELLNKPSAFDHSEVASAVFSQPAVGAVGLTEEEARAKGHRLKIFSTKFLPMKHVVAGNEQRVLMKLIVDAGDDRVLGVHIVGAEAPELIQLAAIAVKARLQKSQWDLTCAVHPTAAEELVLLSEPTLSDAVA